jgi:hypothetical protein
MGIARFGVRSRSDGSTRRHGQCIGRRLGIFVYLCISISMDYGLAFV